ncbi:hypothetical protein SLS62_003118 [Diatrype stigma]|uniref:Dienelactone hydrolase domain-containing protein n=1 Tax=Diatrype stigma TaxID=117547 RepID=A0AAN9YUH3_9PEZI
MASQSFFEGNGSFWKPVGNGSLFETVGASYPLYPRGVSSPGADITIFPNDTTVLTFDSTGIKLSLALPIISLLLDADRNIWPVSCTYPLSGQYDHLPRVLFYILIVFAILFRHRTRIAEAALGVVMSYSATACIHLFVLLGAYKFGLPWETLGRDVEDAKAYGDVDFWGIAPVVAVSAIVLIPILTWSESFKGSRGKAIIVYWSLLIFVSFAIICSYVYTFGTWYFDRIESVTSCKKSCPMSRSFVSQDIPLWNVDDYNSDECQCNDFCGLISPDAPLRKKQGMVPLLYYEPSQNHYCRDLNEDPLCIYPSAGARHLSLAVFSLWVVALFLGLLALLGVNSSSESVRNTIFRAANMTCRDVVTTIFKGQRQQAVLKKLRLQTPHRHQTAYRRFRRLVAKSVAALYYGLAFVGLVLSPVLFATSIIAIELFLGSISTSERSDAIGSWAPWVAAMLVLLSSAIIRLTRILVEIVSRTFTKIRWLIQYSSEERRELETLENRQSHVEPFLEESIEHVGYAMMHSYWYFAVRIKAFIEWWRDPEKYSVNEYRGHGVLEGLHGLDVYVAEPASGQPPKGFIVLIPDAFGWDFVNIQLMADNFARKKDYRVYVPDFMNGHSAPLYIIDKMKALEGKTWWDTLAKPYHGFWLLYAVIPWIIPNRFSKTFPRVKAFFEALRRNEGAHLPVGVTGYCWGGNHVVQLAAGHKADGKPLVDAAFTAHPSMLKFYGDIEKIRVPTSFAIPSSDPLMSLEQAEGTRKIVEALPDGQKGEVQIYEGYAHGFACRIDPKNADPEGPERAENQALAWFEKHFEGIVY